MPHILVIEDDEEVRSLISEFLVRAGHVVHEAANGIEGTQVFDQNDIDIVITDIMMPNIDGFELCSTIKTNFKTSHIPIIILTAKADSESRIEGLEHGADAYLYKPFDKKELEVRVKPVRRGLGLDCIYGNCLVGR